MSGAALALKSHVFDRPTGQLVVACPAVVSAGETSLLDKWEVVSSVTLHVQVPRNRITSTERLESEPRPQMYSTLRCELHKAFDHVLGCKRIDFSIEL